MIELCNLKSMLTQLEGLSKTITKMPDEIINNVPEGEERDKIKAFVNSVKADAKNLDHKSILSKVEKFKKEMDAS